ncbi:MAG: DUF362 domain-containing protein [Candidatus Geothermincolia bacterium]
MGRKKWQIDLALRFWALTHVAKRLGHIPPFKQMARPIAGEKSFTGSFIPVDEFIEIPPSVVAPRELLVDFISRASHRTIINECPCRAGEGCEKHPIDLGCLLIGEGSRDVDPGVGRSATVAEALAHVDRALESGLLPLIGHIWIDKIVFGIDDWSRLMTVCFCCRCCCVVRSEMRGLIDAFPRSLVKLEGVRVEVTEECVGCGECVPVCPVDNVILTDGSATIGDKCLGCGTCARTCSRGRIKVTIEPDAAYERELRRRIETGVDIT